MITRLVALFIVVLGVLQQGNCQALYETGKEYKYQYEGLFTTGTEEPTPYASAYRLKATLRIQGEGTSIVAKLENISIALYNGKWSYFPTPDFNYVSDKNLESLQEPFKIVLTNDGKFQTLVMNDQEPEFASNLKRGLATYLQMNLTYSFDSMKIFKDTELTTMGECPTAYEITPVGSTAGLVKVGKFRNHADCLEVPKRTRYGSRTFYPCPNDHSRDTLNSTSYSVYDIELNGGKPIINRITVLSSILYWPFTSGGHFLYSWYNLTLALDEVIPIKNAISGPENAENHEDLAFVFEQSDYQDPEEELPDLKTVEPFFFHQTASDPEPESLEILIANAKNAITAVAKSLETQMDTFRDYFHSHAPLTISWSFSFLDYESLKKLYAEYVEKSTESKRALTELQLCIDGLVTTGTSATMLVLRDIILESEDLAIITRIISIFPTNMRNPSEALMVEFEPVFDLLKGSKLNKTLKRILELSLATLVSHGCKRNLCTTSGILDKYVNYFENKFFSSTHFEEQTVAILGLRNLKIGKSLNKVLEVALGNIACSNSVRIQALLSVTPLIYRSPDVVNKLLQVFFNRSESCEVRTTTFGVLMAKPDPRKLHEIAYFMWSETCPQTINIVRSTLTAISNAAAPCALKVQSYAKTILKYLPPGEIDPTKTTAYVTNYLDKEYGFGRTTFATVQKSGKSALPVSIYVGGGIYVGGVTSQPLAIFIRLQGLENFIPSSVFNNSINEDSVNKILKILSTLRVEKRIPTPLKLELTLFYFGKAVLYFAADADTLGPSVAQLYKRVKEVEKLLTFSWERTILLGEVLYQQPLEVGVPVSVYTSGVIVSLFSSKTNTDPQNSDFIETDSEIQYNIYARTTISNHAPFRGIMHRAGFARTLRARFPQHFSFHRKLITEGALNFTYYVPTAENPSVVQVHAIAYTLIMSEDPTQKEFMEVAKQSCPTCYVGALVRKGTGYKSGQLGTIPKYLKGMQGGVNLFMCEKSITKADVFNKFKHYLGAENTRIFDISLPKITLGLQHMVDYYFYWPHPDYCGLTVFVGKNSANASEILDKVQVSLSINFNENKKTMELGTLVVNTNIELKYGGISSSEKTISLHLMIKPEKEGFQYIKAKGTLIGNSLDYNGVGCIEINNHATVPKSDSFSLDGDNDPKINQTITIQVGKFPKGDANFIQNSASTKCSDNQAAITITGFAERSFEQTQELINQPSLPYILCHLERNSGTWPENIIPPTPECFQVAMDQTGLRKINLTINYKVAEALQKRWSVPMNFIGNLLSPYVVDPSQDKVHQHNQDHSHRLNSASSANYHQGEIEIDMNLRKDGPVMDVHFIGSSKEEQHFHDVDLNLLPDALQLQPVPSRFSHLTQFIYKFGFLGSCTVSPDKVVTFDNLKYSEKLSECETLIAADCTEDANFAISAKRSKDSKLIIHAQLGADEVQISNEKLTLNGNANPVFSDSGVLVTRKHLIITKTSQDITLKSNFHGVEVRYANKGAFVQITLPSRYRGVTCGLCGNYDTTAYNDLKGPSTPYCPQSSMISAWSTPSETCAAQKVC